MSKVPNNATRDEDTWMDWNNKGMAIWNATNGHERGCEAFHMWSRKSEKYDEDETEKRWQHYFRSPPKDIGAGSVCRWANEACPGWREEYEREAFAQLAELLRRQQPETKPVEQPQPGLVPEVETQVEAEEGWPVLGAEALYGLPGEVVRVIGPHSESDPAALVIQLLLWFGNAIGRGVHWKVESTQHFTNLFVVLVGDTSEGRKGTSADRIREIMSGVADDWVRKCTGGGLSSGEGLIWRIRDEVTKTDKDGNEVVVDPGVDDKRLLIDEREFSHALTVGKRDGNTAHDVLREAWDGRDYLTSMTKRDQGSATNPHISVGGHITPNELRSMLGSISIANGFANRFLFLCVKRSKFLAFGGRLAQSALDALSAKLRERYERVWLTEKEIAFDEEAGLLWGGRDGKSGKYRELATGRPGLQGAICARAPAQVRRLAVLYAVLDASDVVKLAHLKAALALWKYCEDSARCIFGDKLGDALADALLQALRDSGGMSRTQIHDRFKNSQHKDKIDAALTLLENYGRVEGKKVQTGGRPTEIWVPVKGK